MTWCGYIDMLGTRQLARRSPRELVDSLDNFHSALADNFDQFNQGRCIAFSDGAFFSMNTLDDFFPFYKRVRNQLFQQGIFFKCCVIKGEIPMLDRETDDKGNYLNKSAPDFRSFTFSGMAPHAYQIETQFKGVGSIVIMTDFEHDNEHIVKSFYLDYENNKPIAKQYYDVIYSPFETSREGYYKEKPTFANEIYFADEIIISCHHALTQSDRIGSKFLSAFVSIIRSNDVSLVEFDPEVGLQNAPYLFNLLMSGSLSSLLKDLHGINYLLLASYDHLFRSRHGEIPRSVERYVVSRMLRTPACFRSLDVVPDFVISSEARHHLVRVKARYALDRPFMQQINKSS